MTQPSPFADLVETQSSTLSRTEHRVARHFANNRHEVLVQSAMELARATGTSDATIIRTARALGFDGLEGMRRAIAEEFNANVTPAGRLSRTIVESGGDLKLAFDRTLDTQLSALTTLRDSTNIADYEALVRAIADARETAVFGLGPSASMAQYFCTQLRRFGLPARPITATGLLLADELLPLQPGDFVLIMAYGRVYAELEILIERGQNLGLQIVLLTDSLEQELGARVSRVIPVARGRSDAFSLHTATVAFLEAILVGLATLLPQATLSSLGQLNRLRADIAGQAMMLTPHTSGK